MFATGRNDSPPETGRAFTRGILRRTLSSTVAALIAVALGNALTASPAKAEGVSIFADGF